MDPIVLHVPTRYKVIVPLITSELEVLCRVSPGASGVVKVLKDKREKNIWVDCPTKIKETVLDWVRVSEPRWTRNVYALGYTNKPGVYFLNGMYVDPYAAGEIICLKYSTVCKYINEEKLPAIQFGKRQYLLKVDDLHDYAFRENEENN